MDYTKFRTLILSHIYYVWYHIDVVCKPVPPLTILLFICQMILEAILPFYLRHFKDQTKKKDESAAAREELSILCHLSISMKALIAGSEVLIR